MTITFTATHRCYAVRIGRRLSIAVTHFIGCRPSPAWLAPMPDARFPEDGSPVGYGR